MPDEEIAASEQVVTRRFEAVGTPDRDELGEHHDA